MRTSPTDRPAHMKCTNALTSGLTHHCKEPVLYVCRETLEELVLTPHICSLIRVVRSKRNVCHQLLICGPIPRSSYAPLRLEECLQTNLCSKQMIRRELSQVCDCKHIGDDEKGTKISQDGQTTPLSHSEGVGVTFTWSL